MILRSIFNSTRFKRVTAVLLAAITAVAFSIPAMAAPKTTTTTTVTTQTVYLKGSGSNFTEQWKNEFYVGGAQSATDPNVWHLEFTGKVPADVTSMQLTFTNGEVFTWDPGMGFSTNSGGNNPGWVVAAPYDWQIAYVNSGNNNASGSFVVTAETGNINFNISGFHQGKADPQPPEPPTPPTQVTVSLAKTVDGQPILDWASAGGYTLGQLNALMSFTLSTQAGDKIADGALDATGRIVFTADSIPAGTYVITEALTADGAAIFEQPDPLTVTIGADGSVATGGGSGSVDGHTSTSAPVGPFTISLEGMMPIQSVTYPGGYGFLDAYRAADSNGNSFYSFCAALGSPAINTDPDAYTIAANAVSEKKAQLVAALDYIYNHYGLDVPGAAYWSDLYFGRALAQIAVWTIIEGMQPGDIQIDAFSSAQVTSAMTEVLDAVAGGYTATSITDAIVIKGGVLPSGLDYQPQLVPIFGSPAVFNNTTKPVTPPTPPPTGKVCLQKTIDGADFRQWCADNGYDPAQVAAMMSFALYPVSGDGAAVSGAPVAIGTVDSAGAISFDPSQMPYGWYAVVETLTPDGQALFEAPSPLYISVGGEAADAPSLAGEFTGSTNEGSQVWATDYFAGSPTAVDDTIYNFSVTDTATGTVYPSICGNKGSSGLAGPYVDQTQAWTADPAVKAGIVAALNYINNKYGNIDSWNCYSEAPADNTKLIAQAAVWMILTQGDLTAVLVKGTTPEYDGSAIDAAIDDVMANYIGATGDIGVVFLAGKDYPDDIVPCQPQIVPVVCDKTAFNNTSAPVQPTTCEPTTCEPTACPPPTCTEPASCDKSACHDGDDNDQGENCDGQGCDEQGQNQDENCQGDNDQGGQDCAVQPTASNCGDGNSQGNGNQGGNDQGNQGGCDVQPAAGQSTTAHSGGNNNQQ